MSWASIWRRARGRAVPGSVVVVLVVVLGVVAWLQPGFAVTDIELNDSGVWVTNPSKELLGRLNVDAGDLDGSVLAGSDSFDVLQDGQSVFVVDEDEGLLVGVDPVLMALTGAVELPKGAQVGLGGGRMGVLAAELGRLWVFDPAMAGSFAADDPAFAPVLEDVGGDAVLALGRDGTAHVADPGAGSLKSVSVDGDVSEAKLEGVAADSALSVTAVGGQGVVLDSDKGRLYTGQTVVNVRAGSGAKAAVVLQQPGESDAGVAYQNGSELVVQPLAGGEPEATEAEGAAGGIASAGVVTGGCRYAVWSGTGAFSRDCPGKDLDLSMVLDKGGDGQDLRLRVNRDKVVLNQIPSGSCWLITGDVVKIDDWSAVEPNDEKGDEEEDQQSESPEQARPERGDQEAPIARDDHYGVRPGRSALLSVLDNDEDKNGDLLTVALRGNGPSIGEVQTVFDNTAFQIAVPQDASGSAVFTYEASDGAGGLATATVTLEVHPFGDPNVAPEPKNRDVRVVVGGGASATYNVLGDWIDPDGDDLFLASAAAGGSDAEDLVQFRPDGTVTFQDAGVSTGLKQVDVVVSDGQDSASGTLVLDVRPAGASPPVANVDHAAGLVGTDIAVDPLANDLDPDGRPLRLTSVGESPGVSVVWAEAGAVTVRSEQPVTVYLPYGVTDGSKQAEGWIRVDAREADTGDLPPVAVRDTALLPAAGSTLVNVLWNDVDPQGGVLVVTAAQTDVGGPVSVAVLGHETLRVSEVTGFTEPQTVTYTVSNEVGSATGTVTVIPVPPPERYQPPQAVDDDVRVRAGDIVTVRPLDNDVHPDGAELTLVPDLVSVVPEGAGLVFTSGDLVRFHAGDKSQTVKVTYQVTDGRNDPVAAQIVIRVIAPDPEHNAPPEPPELAVRTVSGEATDIVIPLDGVDPDGDFVSLRGLGRTAAAKGMASVGDGVIRYEAAADATGYDVLTYSAVDRLGATKEGKVTIGIAKPSVDNHPPVAVDDKVQVLPERRVALNVLGNDSDPDGNEISLAPDGAASDDLEVTQRGQRISFTSPKEEGFYTASYVVVDSFGASAAGTVSIEVTEDAPPRKPLLRDDYVAVEDVMTASGTVRVAVLDNDEDPDGDIEDGDLEVDASDVTVAAEGVLEVPVAAALRIIDYSVTDPDGLIGRAFIIVPGSDTAAPVFKPGVLPAEVVAGETLAMKLADYVLVRPGRSPLVATNSLTSWHAAATQVVSQSEVSFTAPADYYGPASLSVPVMDGLAIDDPGTLTATVTIPVTVLPGPDQADQNTPPRLTGPAVNAERGGPAGELDLNRYAEDSDSDELEFVIAPPTNTGVTAALDGAMLSVQADTETPEGVFYIPLTVSDGVNPLVEGRVTVTVVASARPQPRAVDDPAGGVHQGVAVRTDVLANDFNPFPDKPLQIVDAQIAAGRGSAPSYSDGSGVIEVTPAADFNDTLSVRYTIEDAVGRRAGGMLTMTVLAKPDQVRGVRVESAGDRTATLSWGVPYNGGSPILEYVVSGSPSFEQSCGTSNVCVLTGMTNDVEYSLTVVARNEVNPSVPSAPVTARPDRVPNLPGAPTLAFGDESLTVTWTNPGSSGSPVTSYDLEISPAPPSGMVRQENITATRLVWSGLANGTAYRVRVCAKNRVVVICDDPSYWGPESASEIPAREPDVAAAPTVERLAPVGSQAQFKVSWVAPANNGDAISKYTVQVLRGGSQVETIEPTEGPTGVYAIKTFNTSTDDYVFKVNATNKAGTSAWSAGSSPVRGGVAPGPVTNLKKTAEGDKNATVSFGAAAGNGAKTSEITYKYRLNTGGTGTLPAGGGKITGLSNTAGCYTVYVHATATVGGTSGYTYDGPESSVGNVCPYGPPNKPGVSASGGATTVALSWTVPAANGRPVKIQISVDGGGWQDKTAGGSTTVGNGYSQSHSIKARTVDSLNQISGEVSASASSGPPPPPWAKVTKGDHITVAGRCTSSYCAKVIFEAGNLSPNTNYTVRYHSTTGMSFWTDTLKTNGDGYIWRDTTYYGFPNNQVWAEVVGQVTSPKITW
ncbi:MAG: tandem-95 repeat protein [Bifidobacteriaceae bacterium]|jgi:hypothetical protein|nr:tandem-95 repeat protein [Bifidobacteriaceae bacterium]